MTMWVFLSPSDVAKLATYQYSRSGGFQEFMHDFKLRVRNDPDRAGHQVVELNTWGLQERFFRYGDDYGSGGWNNWLRSLALGAEIDGEAVTRREAIKAAVYINYPKQESLL